MYNCAVLSVRIKKKLVNLLKNKNQLIYFKNKRSDYLSRGNKSIRITL